MDTRRVVCSHGLSNCIFLFFSFFNGHSERRTRNNFAFTWQGGQYNFMALPQKYLNSSTASPMSDNSFSKVQGPLTLQGYIVQCVLVCTLVCLHNHSNGKEVWKAKIALLKTLKRNSQDTSSDKIQEPDKQVPGSLKGQSSMGYILASKGQTVSYDLPPKQKRDPRNDRNMAVTPPEVTQPIYTSVSLSVKRGLPRIFAKIK